MKKTIIIFSLLSALFSCADKMSTTGKSNKIAILDFQPGIFYSDLKNARAATLDESEIKSTQDLLEAAIAAANDSSQVLKIYRLPYINLANYKRQYVACINPREEKIVWVNCFCNDDYPDWKKSVVSVQDAGICYFNIEINLTRRTYGILYTNSYD